MPLARGFPCVLLAALTACAPPQKVLRYDSETETSVAAQVWPALPEVPRYRYAGQLTGEENFKASATSQRSAAQKLLRWVAGLSAQRRHRQRLVRPQMGAVDNHGRIYVTDIGRRAVFVFDEALGKLHVWDRVGTFEQFRSPIGITLLANGEVLVVDSELARVVRLARDGEPLGSFGAGILARPAGIANDPDTGRVYVADTAEHNIKIFGESGELVDVIGRPGTAPGEFNAPTHLAVVAERLYVSDTLNARVQVLSLAGDPLENIGKRGLFVGNLTRPKGVGADSDGNVYVVESYYDHLLVFDGAGRFLLPIGGSGSAIGKFFLPAGIWIDARGRVFVADMFNGRIMIFQYLGA